VPCDFLDLTLYFIIIPYNKTSEIDKTTYNNIKIPVLKIKKGD
jgi:hypothetical protein